MAPRLPVDLRPAVDSLRELLTVTLPAYADLEPQTGGKPWAPDTQDVYCHRCGESAGPGEADVTGCHACRGKRPPYKRVVRLGAYRLPLSKRIVAMKFGRAWPWARHFGHLLAEAIGRPDGRRPTLVCPVPLHWRRRLSRGYDQTMLIAQAMARRLELPCLPVLRRVVHTPALSLHPPTKREQFIRNAFAARPIDLRGHDVWLVDDVLTTGATLRSACRTLRECRPARINVAVVAKAEPTTGDFAESR